MSGIEAGRAMYRRQHLHPGDEQAEPTGAPAPTNSIGQGRADAPGHGLSALEMGRLMFTDPPRHRALTDPTGSKERDRVQAEEVGPAERAAQRVRQAGGLPW